MSIIDFTDTIIAKSDQLNASDIAGSMTIKITDGKKVQDVVQPIQLFYEGGGEKPWKPCKTMRRIMAHVWGSKVDVKGKSITLICDPKVIWQGAEVGGIRITHMSHIKEKMVLPVRISRHKVEKYTVLPLGVDTVKSEPVINSPSLDDLRQQGEEITQDGLSELQKWFKALSNEEKLVIKPYMEDLKSKAQLNDNEEGVM